MHAVLRKTLGRTLANQLRSYHASVLPTFVSTSSPEFTAKSLAMDELVGDLETKLAEARQGGGLKASERMRNKGKRLPRERLGLMPMQWFNL